MSTVKSAYKFVVNNLVDNTSLRVNGDW